MSHADYCLGNEGESREFNNKTVDFCSCAIKFVGIQSICRKVKKPVFKWKVTGGEAHLALPAIFFCIVHLILA